jgi:ATP-binding cassette subfamily C protein CydC
VQAGTLGLPLAAAVLFVLIASAEPMTSLRRGAVDAARVLLAARRVAPRLQADAPGSASGSAEASPSLSPSLSRTEAAAAIAARCDAIEVAPARLQAVSLQVPVGETVAILGASGAGKSTLLAVLAGELAPTRGTWQALPATRFLQRTELFQDSLRDNLRLVEPNASDARLWTALDAAGLIADVAAMPQGIDTRLGDGGLGLSSGQSRRLALARLVLTRTPLWLLDEPTEGLDARTARDVLRRLRECARGRTVLMATHLRREAAQADRLVWMDGGRIVADCSRGESRFDSLLESLRPD